MLCRPFIGCVDGIALTAIEAVVSEGRLIKAGAVIRASDLARRWVFLAAGVHLHKLGSFQLHGIETSSENSQLISISAVRGRDISFSLNPPPLVEEPKRFYRSGVNGISCRPRNAKARLHAVSVCKRKSVNSRRL